MKNSRLYISLVLGLTISGVAMYLAFRRVHFGPLVDYLGAINYWWSIPAMLVGVLAFMLRVVRWRIIMSSVAKIGFWEAYHPMMIGFMANCILPGRVGEFARPAILLQKRRVPFFQTLATVAAERVFDLIMLLGLFALVTYTVEINPGLEVRFDDYMVTGQALERAATAIMRLSLLMIAGIVLISFNASRGLMERIILAAPAILFFLSLGMQEKVRAAVCQPMVSIIQGIAKGFETVKSVTKVLACLGLSVLIWVLITATYWIMALGCPELNLTVYEMTAMMVIICFAISLPSAPGFWGLWEAGGIFALALFGVARAEAAGFTLVNHVLQLLPPIAMGLVSALITGVSIRQISSAKTSMESEEAPLEGTDSQRKGT